ncbi:hypothetical protein GGI42DRAFT_134842 [Trichoderma sp. SZMC 28013]
MKASVVALLLTGLVAAQDFTGQPDCAIGCLKDAIPKAGCALTDTACQCQVDTQAKLVGLAAPCLISKCSPSDLAKAQAAAAAACKKDTTGSSSSSSSSSTEASSHTSASESSSETTAAGSTTESTTEAGTTTDAGTTTTGPASTAATETTGSETTASETTASSSSHATSAGHTSPTSPPGGVSNSTTSGVRSVVTRTSTAFVDGGSGGSQTSGAPASTTLAGNDASAPAAGILGAVLAALMAL